MSVSPVVVLLKALFMLACKNHNKYEHITFYSALETCMKFIYIFSNKKLKS